MKKLLSVIAAIAIAAGAYAQADSANRKTSPENLNNTQKQTMQNNPQDLNIQKQNLQNKPQDVNTQNPILQNNPQDLNNKNQNMQNNPQDLNKSQKQNMQINPQDQNNKNLNKQNNPQDLNNKNQNMENNPVAKTHPDGLMMQNGKMMVVKNGQMTSLDHDMTLSNGTKIMSDGTCIKKDGSKMTVKEGQHMDMSGNMVPMKTSKDKKMNLAPDSTRTK